MTPTAMLLVPVPEVETYIDPLRRRLDPSWRQGMPAHVTLLVPFPPVDPTSDPIVPALRDLFEQFAPFDFALRRTRWFDDRVLYLAPEPAEPFRRLTGGLVKQFPDHPPYGGAFPDIVPHVTVGEGGRWRKRRRSMRRAVAALDGMAPIPAHASEAWLMELSGASSRWRRTATFPLGGLRSSLLPSGWVAR